MPSQLDPGFAQDNLAKKDQVLASPWPREVGKFKSFMQVNSASGKKYSWTTQNGFGSHE